MNNLVPRSDPVSPLISIDRLVERLADRIEPLCRELLPGGRRAGSVWRDADRAAGGTGVEVVIGWYQGGHWRDPSGKSGKVLELIAHTRFDGDLSRAILWARDWLDLRDAGRESERATLRRIRRAAAYQRAEHAARIWNEGMPDITGTLADRWLSGQGVAADRLPNHLHCLRFHPATAAPGDAGDLPALLAAVTDMRSCLLGVHRTWLSDEGGGRVRALRASHSAAAVGHVRGGAVPLVVGDGTTPLAKVPHSSVAHVFMSLLDALTIAALGLEIDIALAAPGSLLATIDLPPAVERVVIWTTRLSPGSRTARTFDRAVERFRRDGRTVEIKRPPDGYADFASMFGDA